MDVILVKHIVKYVASVHIAHVIDAVAEIIQIQKVEPPMLPARFTLVERLQKGAQSARYEVGLQVGKGENQNHVDWCQSVT